MVDNDTSSENPQGTLQIPLEWGSSEGLETIYVNQLAITNSGAEVYIVFGELTLPIIHGENRPEKLVITPKVRLVVNSVAMQQIAQVIQQTILGGKGQ